MRSGTKNQDYAGLCKAVLLAALMAVVAAMLAFSPRVFAQAAGAASIQGTVSDPSGAVIPGATVTLTQVSTHVQRITKSTAAGLYSFPGVPVGTYTLTVQAPSFQTYTQTHIVLEVGSSIAINPTLSVGTTTQRVEVRAQALALQTGTASIKQTIDSNEMMAMPLNGRQMTNLITISGGTTPAPGGDATGSKYTYQAVTISVAGGGGGGNTTSWQLDGGSNMDYMSNVNLPYPFPDAVSQFSVESTALGAQTGGHMGGMVNVVTKSGTNQFHGDMFEFIRNNFIDATNFFSSSPDTLHQNQFGGTIGGPIIRNKMFGFAGYQRTEAKQSQASKEAFVPTADNLNGNFSVTDGPICEASGKFVQLVNPLTGAVLPNDIFPTPPQYNAQALALQKYFLKIDPKIDVGNCGLISYSIPSETFDNQFISRVDLSISQRNHLYGHYFIDGYQAPAFYSPTNIFVTTQSGNIERVQSVVLGDAYTFTPQLVNAAHLTVLRRTNHRGYNTSDINAATLGVKLYQTASAGLQVSTPKWDIGGGTNSIAHFNDNALVVADDVTWIHGKQQLAFGGKLVRNQLNIGNVFEGNGHFSFNGEYSGSGPGGGTTIGDSNLDFLMGTMNSFSQSSEQQNAMRGWIPALYIQDTYHASPRLTLIGGLRWNPNFMPVDYFNRGTQFDRANFLGNVLSTIYPSAPAGALFYGDKGVSREFTRNSPWQFSPNVGVTFDPTGNGDTVLRAGANLVYNNPNYFTSERAQSNPPFASDIANVQTSTSGPLSFSAPWSVGSVTSEPFPQPNIPTAAEARFFPQSQYIFLAPHFHAAYSIQWTLSVQHQFGRGWQGQLSYIGNATRHAAIGLGMSPAVFIPGVWGPNGTGCDGIVRTGPAAALPGAPGSNCSTTKNETARFLLTTENPEQGNMYEGGGNTVRVSGEATANYNGMIATVQHRLSSTFSVLANWTWSKCLDIVDGGADTSGTSVEDIDNPALDYGPCGADFRNIENLSLVTRSDFHGMDRFARLVLNDWEFAPLMHIASGGPVNVTAGVDNSLTDVGNDRPNLVRGVDVYHRVSIRRAGGEANREYLNPAAFEQVTASCAKNSSGNLLPGCEFLGTYGNIGRNAFRGPGTFDLDAQISRSFPVEKERALVLRLESFNVLNHPNFNNPSANLTSSTFGQISGSSAARVFQGAIKFQF